MLDDFHFDELQDEYRQKGGRREFERGIANQSWNKINVVNQSIIHTSKFKFDTSNL